MLFSLNLIEIFPLGIINIFFFFIFFVVLLLSYPLGRYFLSNYCENSLIKNSIFSLAVFAALISIIINLAPILAKYVIVTFYLINLFILTINLKIRDDLFKAIISFKFILIAIFLIFLILNLIFKQIFIEGDELNFFFDTHYTYFINPISEALTSDYFSRLKILSLYPAEWSSYHFFQASFNSIFLAPIYLSGTIGLLVLKNFYLSIFLSLFFFSFFKDGSFTKEEYLLIILKVFLIILLFVYFFSLKIIWLIQTNGFVTALLIIFIVQSFFSKNKNDFLIWVIILSLSSFRNSFISLMLAVYYLIDTQNFNFKIFIDKIRKSLNLPNLLLVILFLLYLISTFYQSEIIHPKYNLPTSRSWWAFTTSNQIIENYIFFITTLILLIAVYLFLFKYFFKEKLNVMLHLNRQDFFYFSLVLIIPLTFTVLLIFKNQILDTYLLSEKENILNFEVERFITLDIVSIERLKIFFDTLNITNLSFYFFVPLLWFLILFGIKNLLRYIFLILIIIHTFLSIFINNAVILPAFFITEILALFFLFHIFLKFENNTKKKILSYLFVASMVITNVFNHSAYSNAFEDYNSKEKLVFNIKDLKDLKKKEYLCPHDIKNISSGEYFASALSGILVKPYYSDISINDRYLNWGDASARWAASSKKYANNPCKNN